MKGLIRLTLASVLAGHNLSIDLMSSESVDYSLFAQTTSSSTVGPSIRYLFQPSHQIIARALPLGCQCRMLGKGFNLRSQLEIDDLQLAAFQVLWLRGLACTIDWYYCGPLLIRAENLGNKGLKGLISIR